MQSFQYQAQFHSRGKLIHKHGFLKLIVGDYYSQKINQQVLLSSSFNSDTLWNDDNKRKKWWWYITSKNFIKEGGKFHHYEIFDEIMATLWLISTAQSANDN
jgi:hypothetical protein